MNIETPPTEKPYERSEGERRGLVIVNTGDGKGKSTAAFGLALRAHGRGKADAGGGPGDQHRRAWRNHCHAPARTKSPRPSALRGNASRLQRGLDLPGQFGAAEVERRAIDGNFQRVAARSGQLPEVLAGLAQHPVVEVGDQAVGFGDRDKAVGRKYAVGRVLPANQRFHFGYLIATQIKL